MSTDARTAWERARDSALAILASEVEGIANLHGSLEIAETEADAKRLFVESPPDRLHTWMIDCRRVTSTGELAYSRRRIELVIYGFLAFRYAGSHDEHLQRSFRVMDALREHFQAGEDSGVTDAEEPSLEAFELTEFQNQACWRSTIVWPLTVIEPVTRRA